MNRILIIGGAGFIGSHLALFLINKGHEVTVLDNLSQQIHGTIPEESSPTYQSIKNAVRFINGSITSKKILETTLLHQDIVVHLAAETGTGQSMYAVARYTQVNIQGTALLLETLCNKKHSVKKVILASSRAIYGEGKYFSNEKKKFVYPDHRTNEDMSDGDFEIKYPGCMSKLQLVATDEDSKIHPSSVYGITKYTQEQMIMTVCATLGIKAVGLRYQNVYGPGQSLINPYTGILSIFSSLIKEEKMINVFEDGNQSRDFVYIDDVVNATYLCMINKNADGEVFNVGFGQTISVLKVAETLVEKFKRNTPIIITGNYRLGDIRHNYADLAKIKSKIGFVPQIDFDTGITAFVDWVYQQKTQLLSEKFENSLKEMKKKNLLNQRKLN